MKKAKPINVHIDGEDWSVIPKTIRAPRAKFIDNKLTVTEMGSETLYGQDALDVLMGRVPRFVDPRSNIVRHNRPLRVHAPTERDHAINAGHAPGIDHRP